MRAPAIQLYYRDWMSHPGLRMCSIAARGLFADMMCIMAEGTPYGYLKVGAKDILPPVLARRVGESLPDIEGWLAELEEHDVFQRDASGSIYSTRMVEVERIRQARAAGGVKSQDNPKVPRRKDRPKDILGGETRSSFRPSPAVASASASAVTPSPSVNRFLEALPAKQNQTSWAAIIRGWESGQGLSLLKPATPADIETGLSDYLAEEDRDFNVAHIRRFIERVRDDRLKPRANSANGSRPSVAEQGYANAKLAIQDL